jgi:peptidoglycan/xylan/chitin deacetylase (PgdA/CDA1 family)
VQRRCRDAARWIWLKLRLVAGPVARAAWAGARPIRQRVRPIWERVRRGVRARPALSVAMVFAFVLIALGASPTPRPALVLQLGSAARPSPSPTASTPEPPPPSPSDPASPAPPASPGTKVLGGPGGSAQLTGTAGVALTFDDGPDPVNTPRLLDLLKQYNVKATFCLVGFRARDHPDLVRRIVAEGHTVCNHSWQHDLRLAMRPPDRIRGDLQATNDAIHNAAPDAQIKYFRAPGGNFTTGLVGIAHSLGMASLYWWVDPRDWDDTHDGSPQAHVSRVAANVRNRVKPGAIVLSHDNGQPETIVAYKQLLPWLKDRYTLIAMPT